MINKRKVITQAKRIVKQYQQSTHPCETDMDNITKSLNISIIPYDFSEGISGVFFRKNKQLFIGVNRLHSIQRQRFTIAHEIGHYILHSLDTIHYDTLNQEDVFYRAQHISRLEETEANIFAAELLMPEESVTELIAQGTTSVLGLASVFKVSEDAMRYRLIHLGYL